MDAGILRFPLLGGQGQGSHFVLPWHLVFKFSQPRSHGYKSPLMCLQPINMSRVGAK